MASFSLNASGTFTDGTSVGAYLRSQWGVEGLTGAPSGGAVASGTVSGGTVALTGLADSTEYIAYASSPNRYERFRTPASTVVASGTELEYAEYLTNNYNLTTTAATDVPQCSITFTAPAGPVAVRFGVPDMWHSVANTIILLQAIRVDNSAVLTFFRGSHATAAGRIPCGAQQARVSGLTPGTSYTFKLQTVLGAAGTMTLGTGVAGPPVWIQAVTL